MIPHSRPTHPHAFGLAAGAEGDPSLTDAEAGRVADLVREALAAP